VRDSSERRRTLDEEREIELTGGDEAEVLPFALCPAALPDS
jgi:hypothetical protein